MPTVRDDSDSTSSGGGSGGGGSLADLCNEALLLIFHVRQGGDPGHPDDLRRSIGLIFQDLEKRAARAGHAEEDIKAARYALCALIDETLLNSRWSFRDQWADRPLQLQYFDDQIAGERFFDLLERIRQKGRRKGELLEVFCTTLILGFQGKYKLGGREELQKLLRALVEETEGYRGGGPRGLSPHWDVPEEPLERPPSPHVPRWVWLTGVASIVFLLVAFVVLKLWLGSLAAEAARRLFF